MICVELKIGEPVFLDTYQLDEHSNIIGQKKSKEGKQGKFFIPRDNVRVVSDWAEKVL